MILIFGDEVQTKGSAINGRIPVEFRNRPGYIKEKDLGDKAGLELYFIDVGQGDSTFIVTPGRKKILIDGGINQRAHAYLAWKYRLDQPGTSVDTDLLVLSHADTDHLNGLVPIITHPCINVKKVIHSGIATFKSGEYNTELGDLDPTGTYLKTHHNSLEDLAGLNLSDDFTAWKNALVAEAMHYSSVDVSDETIDLDEPEIAVDILGPRRDTLNDKPVSKWFKDKSKTINGHSVVLRLTFDKVLILFSGDLNIEGAKHLIQDDAIKAKMDAHVFKAPHHGSHEFYIPFLKAVSPQISIISSGDEPDHGHPRAVFIGGVGLASRSDSPLIFSTEIASFVETEIKAVTEEDDNIEAEDFATSEANKKARHLFKRRLHGMINVRTDGKNIYAARRVAAGYWWESYGPLVPAQRPDY